MKFPFQHMHWTQHKSHNREFNLKLIYWWNVIRIPMKTNKSTWHWEKKINWGRWKLPATAIRSRGKSYTNWSASAKPEWNVPSAILDSEMKSFEVKMLMVANICSFHKKQTPDFELWNPAVASCFHFPPILQKHQVPARNRTKRSGIFVVQWPNFTNTRFRCFSF